MKTKLLSLLLVGSTLAAAAWYVSAGLPVREDSIPAKYRPTVQKGLDFLAKNQASDGHWEGDNGQHPVAMTGLVGLALLMEKDTPIIGAVTYKARELKYSANVRKAADWLIAKSQSSRDGLIFSDHPSETARYMQGHGLATLFLAGVLKNEEDVARVEKLTEVLNRAVKYIVKAQSSQGGWYRTSKAEGHDFDEISVTVIQIQALQAAECAGVPVPRDVISDAQEYLKNALTKYEKDAKAAQNHDRLAETAGALSCLRSLWVGIRGGKEALNKKWFTFCETTIPADHAIQFGRHELAYYYYTQSVFNLNADTGTAYRTAILDQLQRGQNKNGSWPAGNGISIGQVYSTALWCVVLQLDHKSHPSRQLDPGPISVTLGTESWPRPMFAMTSFDKPKS